MVVVFLFLMVTASGAVYIQPVRAAYYDVTIWAWDSAHGWISMSIFDGNVDTGFDTPHTFGNLTGTHYFQVPSVDSWGNPFIKWNTGATGTLVVSEGGTYTAEYYSVYSITIKGYVIGQGEVSTAIFKDGSTYTEVYTPHEFTGLYGTHTFKVFSQYMYGAFKQWDTGETSTTITVTQGGTYTALYYKPTFGLIVVPTTRTVTAGQSTTYEIAATPGGYIGNVVWTYYGVLPNGFEANFVPKVVDPNDPDADTSTVIVSTTTQSEPGTYELHLRGSAIDAQFHLDAMVELIVAPAPTPTPTPTATPSPTPLPTSSPSPSPSPSPTPTPTPTPTVTPTPTPTPTATTTPTPTSNSYTLTLSFTGSGTTNPSPGIHTYANGAEVPVQASSNTNWTFDHWLLDETVQADINPVLITMSRDRDVKAVFIQAQPASTQTNLTPTPISTPTPTKSPTIQPTPIPTSSPIPTPPSTLTPGLIPTATPTVKPTISPVQIFNPEIAIATAAIAIVAIIAITLIILRRKRDRKTASAVAPS